MKILIASNNMHKIKEIQDIFSGARNIELLTADDIDCNIGVEENGRNYFENALLKAKAYRKYCEYPILADDSGLEISCWQGQPGIHSARFLGKETDYRLKNEEIIRMLNQEKNRHAEFVSCALLLLEDDTELVFEGRLVGNIGYQQIGQNGFGYDPIFVLEDGRSLAELSEKEKNTISHRAIAFKEMLEYIERMYES